MFRAVLSPAAQRVYQSANRPLAKKLARCFQTLERDPRRHSNIKPLHGPFSGSWRFRVGDYRVIYQIDDATELVTVTAIVHRREAYD